LKRKGVKQNKNGKDWQEGKKQSVQRLKKRQDCKEAALYSEKMKVFRTTNKVKSLAGHEVWRRKEE
jgi:hypothetical protein